MMQKLKQILSFVGAVTLALLCCPESYCDGAVQVDAHDVNLLAEFAVIYKAAVRNHCYGDDFIILLAIRLSEGGRPGREFGVLDARCLAICKKYPDRTLDIQAGWSAATIVKNRQRWLKEPACNDNFIIYLADRYCPKETDSEGNKNWKRNVRYWYEYLSG